MVDIDSTDAAVHGRQEGRSIMATTTTTASCRCTSPVRDARSSPCSGPGNADPAGGVTGPLGRIVARLREAWPWLKVLLRADSAYPREELMAWCKDNDVDYVIGLARNSRLAERVEWLLDDAAAEAERKGRPARLAPCAVEALVDCPGRENSAGREVTTKRGFALSARCSAFATTRRSQDQLVRVA